MKNDVIINKVSETADNIYLPDLAEIKNIINETSDTKTFTLQFKSEEIRQNFTFLPGQFIEVSVFGYGEIPVGISSNPLRSDSIEITVRAVGHVTNALHGMKTGNEIGIRGAAITALIFFPILNL